MRRSASSTPGEVDRLRKLLAAETVRSQELERRCDGANAVFEEFVSRMAHDLREPLRAVASYSQLLAESCDGRLDGGSAESLERIRAEAASAQALLADVVDYASAGLGDRLFQRTSMEAVLDQALLLAAKQIAAHGAIITHTPLPHVSGDFDSLTRVLRQLIGNAIQFDPAPEPRIHVCSHSAPGEPSHSLTDESAHGMLVFSVRDNGPGIEPQFQARLFQPFRRLHGRDVSGNGLGLAYCKRVIEWHGGRIWIEPAPGPGATLCFTLPPAE